MATGKPIGTLFVELDLDPTRYMKGQQTLLKEAQHGASILEKNFRNLRTKSDANYDLMRMQAVKSFEAIKNSSQTTANDIVRAERAKADQLKYINEKQFGAQKTLLQGLKDNWLAVTGSIIAAWYAVSKAVSAVSGVAMAAARYETLGVAMEVVDRNAGYSAYHMAAFQKGLESTGISMAGARQALTRMAQAQLDLKHSSDLARVAQDAAVIGAMNSTEAFNNMVYGIQTANVRVLRTIGINVSWEESYKKMAKQLGRTSDSFSVSEKATIRLNAVLEAGKKIAGTYEAAMGTAGKKLLSLERHIDNFKVTVGTGLLPVLGELVDEATEWFKTNGKILAQDMAGWIRGTVEMIKWGIKPLQIWADLWKTIGFMSGGGVGMRPDLIPEPPKETPSGKTGYPDMSSMLGKPGGGEVGPGEITPEDQMRVSGLEDALNMMRDAETSYRQWEMDTLVASEEYKQTVAQDFHNQALANVDARNQREAQIEIAHGKAMAKFDKDIAKSKYDVAVGLGTALLSFTGANAQAIFLVVKAMEVGKAIAGTHAAAAMALAMPPAPNFAAEAAALSAGYWNVAAIVATSLGQMAVSSGGSTGGGTYTSPTVTTPASTTYEPEPEAEQNRGTLTINIQGDILGDEGYIDMLVDKINAADDRDVFINQSIYAREVTA